MSAHDEFWIGTSGDGIFGTPGNEIRQLLLNADGIAKLGVSVDVGRNPMYLAWSSHHRLLIAAHEVERAQVSAWRRTGSTLTKEGRTRENGSTGACHVSVAKSGWIASANYFGGELRIQELSATGVGNSVAAAAYDGSGPNPERQEQPHPHQAYFDEERDQVLVPDLGTDRIHRHRVDAETGALSTLSDIIIHPGAGPRHLVVVGRLAVVVNELDGSISVIDLSLEIPGVVGDPLYVTDWTGPADDVSGSAIRATSTGLILVGSRGPNTISAFRLDPETAGLKKVAEHATHGDHPRDFELSSDERHIVVANQASDSLTVLCLDPATGALGFAGASYESNSPVSVLRIPIS